MTSQPWEIAEAPTEIAPADEDATLFRFRITRDDDERSVIVAISNTVMAVDLERLDSPVDVIVATRGEAAVRDVLSRDVPPDRITVNTHGLFYAAA